MQPQSLTLVTDLLMAKLLGSVVEDYGDHLAVRSPANPDHWWGNFLVLATAPEPHDIPHWLARFAQLHPDARHCAIALDTAPPDYDPEPWRAHGLKPGRSTAQVLDRATLAPPPHPNTAAVCRPLTSDADWLDLAQLQKDNRGDYPLAEYGPFVDRSVAARRRLVEQGHGQWWGAFLDGQLRSSMGLFSDGLGVARYQHVDTHPDARRQGLAGTLVHAIGRWGLTPTDQGGLGADRLVIVADTDDVAIRVYRSVGFRDTTPIHVFERPGWEQPGWEQSDEPPQESISPEA